MGIVEYSDDATMVVNLVDPCVFPGGADEGGPLGLTIGESVVACSALAWVLIVLAVLTYGAVMATSDAKWMVEHDESASLWQAVWTLVNMKAISNTNVFIIAIVLPGILFCSTLLYGTTSLLMIYNDKGYEDALKHQPTSCPFAIAQVGDNQFRQRPSVFVISNTLLLQVCAIVFGILALVLRSGMRSRMCAVAFSIVWPAMVAFTLFMQRQYATSLYMPNGYSVFGDDTREITHKSTGFSMWSAAAAVEFYAFGAGVGVFVLLGLTKVFVVPVEANGTQDGLAWVTRFGWLLGASTAGVLSIMALFLAYSTTVSDVVGPSGLTPNATLSAYKYCKMTSDNPISKGILGSINDEDKLLELSLSAGVMSGVALLWYIFVLVVQAGQLPIVAPLLTRTRGLAVGLVYVASALWALVIFTNSLSPCPVTNVSNTVSLCSVAPLLLLGAHYGLSVYRVAVAAGVNSNSAYYFDMGAYGGLAM